MTREKSIQMTHECRITSLGEFAHGFVIYQNASKEIINQIYDYFEQRIAELEEEKAVFEAENEKMHTVSVELFNSRSKCLKYIQELEQKLGMELEE